MTKYNFELKYKIVREYIEKKRGYKYLAKKYIIKSEKQIRDWVNNYQKYGKEGLQQSEKNKSYSVDFKINAIETYLTSNKSYREVANSLDMKNPSLIANWLRRFREEGIEGLSNKKGRPSRNENNSNEKDSKEKEHLLAIEKKLQTIDKEQKELKKEKNNDEELKKLRRQKQKERFEKLNLSKLSFSEKKEKEK